jgi:hypothetical protein
VELFDIYGQHAFSNPEPFTTTAQPSLPVPVVPVVSDIRATRVTLQGPTDPNFDPLTMGACLHVFDAGTGDEVYLSSGPNDACGAIGTAPATLHYTWESLTPEHDYVAKVELFDIYGQHAFSNPEPFTTTAVPPLG